MVCENLAETCLVVPVYLVYLIGGVVGIMVSFFRAHHVNPQHEKGDPLGCKDDGAGKIDQFHVFLVIKVGPAGQKLVVQCKVIMGSGIVDAVPCMSRPGKAVVNNARIVDAVVEDGPRDPKLNAFLHMPVSCNEARLLAVKIVSLYGITGIVVEKTDPVQLGGIGFCGGDSAAQQGRASGPSFPVDHGGWIDGIQFLSDKVHGFNVVEPHKIKTEAVYLVFTHPVLHRIDDELPYHGSFGRCFISASRAVGKTVVRIGAVIIARHDLVKVRLKGLVGMVVDHVQDHSDTGVLKGLDHLLQLFNPDQAVLGIGGIGTVGHIEVDRVVSPVVLRYFQLGFINCEEIEYRHQMDMGNSKLPEVGEACKFALGGPGLGFGQAQELAPELYARAFMYGRVPDMDLIQDRVGGAAELYIPRILPARGIGLFQLDDHASAAIDSRRTGIGIGCLKGHPHDNNRVCIILA